MKHSSYRRFALILPLAALLTGCGTTNSKSAQSSTSSSQPAKSASSDTPKSSSSSSHQQGEKKASLWSPNKSKKLSAFMRDWQAKMGQTYSGTYDGQTPDHYGFKFPEALASGRIRIDSQLTTVKWTTTGEEQADWQAVEVATGHPNNRPDALITYLFALHKGVPTVLVTQTNNGNDLFFSATNNQALQEGFKLIIGAN